MPSSWDALEEMLPEPPLALLVIACLPLANAGLIGAAAYLSAGAREPRGGVGEAPRRRPPGFTFLAIHILALVGLIGLFRPDLLREDSIYLNVLAMGLLKLVLKVQRFTSANYYYQYRLQIQAGLQILTHVAALSLVPAIVGALGGWAARRSARGLPRWRFRAVAAGVSLVFVGAFVAALTVPRPFEEEVDVPLVFRVLDEVSGRPIPGAFVAVTDAFRKEPGPGPARALVGEDGRATVADRFLVTGEQNAFWALGDFETWGRWLEVSAPGYRTVRLPLKDGLGGTADFVPTRRWDVPLARGVTPEGPFRDFAGTYRPATWSPSDRREDWLRIEPDGRYALSEEDHVGWKWFHGRLESDGDEVHFIAFNSPLWRRSLLRSFRYRTWRSSPRSSRYGPSWRSSPRSSRYRWITWGDRRYLCPVQDEALSELCWIALTPESQPIEEPWFLLTRPLDRSRPREGRPRIPASIWARFVLGELSLRNEDGALRKTARACLPPSILACFETGEE